MFIYSIPILASTPSQPELSVNEPTDECITINVCLCIRWRINMHSSTSHDLYMPSYDPGLLNVWMKMHLYFPLALTSTCLVTTNSEEFTLTVLVSLLCYNTILSGCFDHLKKCAPILPQTTSVSPDSDAALKNRLSNENCVQSGVNPPDLSLECGRKPGSPKINLNKQRKNMQTCRKGLLSNHDPSWCEVRMWNMHILMLLHCSIKGTAV